MEKRISGHTGLMALFGTPVGHSGSPAMYNFSFQHDGLDYAYMAFDVTEEEMPKVFESIRLLNMRGGNFTMPCKNIAAQLVDKLSPAAEIIGACNVFVNDDGVITGHITDGVGFVKNLELNGVPVKDKKVVVLGAGGAATAIQVQLALDGAKEVNIFNIKDKFFERAEGTKAKLAEKCPECVVTVDDLDDKAKLEEAIKACDILVNATIMGMKPHQDVTLVDKSLFRKDLVVDRRHRSLPQPDSHGAQRHRKARHSGSRRSRMQGNRRSRNASAAGSSKLWAVRRKRNAAC